MGDTPAWFTLAPLLSVLPRDLVVVGQELVVLVELNVVEQRYRAVADVLEGASVVEVARRNGVTRQTVHEWLRRYANDGGLRGLADRSSRPVSCPHQMTAQLEATVVAVRRAHPACGPDRIRWQLGRDGVARLPGRSSIYRALVRHGLVEATRRRWRRKDYRRWERSRSMELWQMDVMGRVHLVDGRELKVITGIDDHSRFVVCAKLVGRATALALGSGAVVWLSPVGCLARWCSVEAGGRVLTRGLPGGGRRMAASEHAGWQPVEAGLNLTACACPAGHVVGFFKVDG